MHFNFYLAARNRFNITKDRKEKNRKKKLFKTHGFPLPSVSYQTHDIACRAHVIQVFSLNLFLSDADFHAPMAACKIESKINPLLVFATPLGFVLLIYLKHVDGTLTMESQRVHNFVGAYFVEKC